MQPDQQQLTELVRQIVEAVHPLRLVLFGSAARGDMRADSDLDLLVVVPEGTHRRHTAQFLYRHLRGVTVPFELIVATPSDLERYGRNPSLIYRAALEEGQALYAA